jgi:tetratricopeptide (TPR) repeat protein
MRTKSATSGRWVFQCEPAPTKAAHSWSLFCAVYERTFGTSPNAPRCDYGVAEAYAKAGNKALAIENYKRSLELDPNNQSAIEHLKELQKS